MSFSNDFVDKIPGSIVPDHRKAVQISERDALRLQISLLKSADDRRACERRIARAEEYFEVATRFLRSSENAYVEEHLKITNDLTLSMGPDVRSVDQIERDLRHDFRELPEIKQSEKQVEQTTERLWLDAFERLEVAKQREAEPQLSKAEFVEKRQANQMTQAFNRSVER